jgi:hypothetical protein
MAQRFKKSGKEHLVLLFMTDHDPEGADIPESYTNSMRDDFGIKKIIPIKVALTYEQTIDPALNLHTDMMAKKGSRRWKKFVERYGENVFELESVQPGHLQTMLYNAIDTVIDAEAFNAEIDREKKDAAFLDGVRKVVKQTLGNVPELQAERKT